MAMTEHEVKYVNELRDRIHALERQIALMDVQLRAAQSRAFRLPRWIPYKLPRSMSRVQYIPQPNFVELWEEADR